MDTLTAEQRSVMDALVAGKNVFLTGGGGTGKSYLLNVIHRHLPTKRTNAVGIPWRISTTALTGCAAVLLGPHAKTVHSWAAIGLGKGTAEELAASIKSRKKAKFWNQTDLLIIDEISMMSAELFEKLSRIGQIIRKNARPFGGIQLLLVGDFFQLPPVIRDLSGSKATPIFAFQTPTWPSAVDVTIELQAIHRQRDDAFRKILTEARRGDMTPESVAALKARCGLKWQHLKIRPTLLFPRRAEVDRINEANLAALTGVRHTYKAGFQTGVPNSKIKLLPVGTARQIIRSDEVMTYYDGLIGLNERDPDFQREVEYMDRDAVYAGEVTLAADAQVMLLVNLDVESGLVNGSRGVVVGFLTESRAPIVEFLNGEKRPIYPHTWLVEEYSTAERKIFRAQVPLRLAYAVTIHKSQGASLDSALIDIGKNTFEYGQAYVALSRVRSLEALYIHAFEPKAVQAHPLVRDFYGSAEFAEAAVAALPADGSRAANAAAPEEDPSPAAGSRAANAAAPEEDPSPAAGGAGRPGRDEEAGPGPKAMPTSSVSPPAPAAPWLIASIPAAWRSVLEPHTAALTKIQTALESRTLQVFPPREQIWAALEHVEPAACRVVILGQDPYPTAGNAHGLAFSVRAANDVVGSTKGDAKLSVAEDIKVPASLRNIYKELESDLGTKPPATGCLTSWAKQGVLLLNTILTVDEGKPLSHEKLGWEPITDAIIKAAAAAGAVFVLWGKTAQAKKKLLPTGTTIIEAPHPSPLSAHTGFFGSKPFSRINAALGAATPIDWSATT